MIYPDSTLAHQLHLLCENENITLEMLAEVLGKQPEAAQMISSNDGKSSLHSLSANVSVTLEMIEVYLYLKHGPEVAKMADKDGKTPLHILCGNISVTLEMVELYLKHGPGAAEVVGVNVWEVTDSAFVWTPLHYLCSNEHVTLEMIEAVIEEFPFAARASDHRNGVKTPVRLRLNQTPEIDPP